MTVFAVVCFVLFLVMLIKSIGIINAPKSIYTEEVRATCIGYLRGYESSNSDGAGSNLHPVHIFAEVIYFAIAKRPGAHVAARSLILVVMPRGMFSGEGQEKIPRMIFSSSYETSCGSPKKA